MRSPRPRGAGLFEATADFARLAEADAILICVPTPLDRHREPDLSLRREHRPRAWRRCSGRARSSSWRVTTYPGTTRDVVLPILEAAGRQPGEDFFLAYSPEREDPGNASVLDRPRSPRSSAATTPTLERVATALYGAVVDAGGAGLLARGGRGRARSSRTPTGP